MIYYFYIDFYLNGTTMEQQGLLFQPVLKKRRNIINIIARIWCDRLMSKKNNFWTNMEQLISCSSLVQKSRPSKMADIIFTIYGHNFMQW